MSEAAPQPKKGMSGCVIALIVAGVIGVVAVLLVLVGLAKVASSPEGQKIVRFVGDSAKMMDEAQKAPGTKELRAKGCMQAMAIDMDKIAGLVKDLSPDASDLPAGSERTLVSCTVPLMAAEVPECDDLAKTYVAAASPAAPFRVTVQQQGAAQAKCTKVYDASGAPK